MRIPIIGLEAEYRGEAPASEFTDRESGARVDLQPNLKFELTLPDGDVDTMALRRNRLDQCADFDANTLKKGDLVLIDGICVISNDEGKRSFFSPVTIRLASAATAKLAAAK